MARGVAALAIAGAALARSPAALAQEPIQLGAPPAIAPWAGGYPPRSPAEMPALPAWANPRTIEFEEGDPILPGYALRTRPSRGLLLGGIITAGSAYASSLLVASMLLSVDNNTDEFGPLFIPFAGPLITISTAHAEGAGTFWLAVDSVLQIGGLVMALSAFASEDFYLERQFTALDDPGAGRGARPPVQPTAWLRPAVAIGPSSAALRWRF